MKHQHRWSEPVGAARATELGWLSPGFLRHGYARKCLGPAGGCGLVESGRILDPVTQSDNQGV